MALMEPGLQDDGSGLGIEARLVFSFIAHRRFGDGGGIAFVGQIHRQMVASFELARETLTARRKLVLGIIDMARQANHEALRLPRSDELGDGSETTIT